MSAFFSLDYPLEIKPTSGQCRAANLSGLADFSRRLGHDPRKIIEHHNLQPQILVEPDSHVGCRALVEVLEYCSGLFDDPVFGAHFAAGQEPEVYGCITALARAAPTLRAAVGCFVDFMPVVHAPDSQVLLLEGTEAAEYSWETHLDVGPNAQAQFQAALLNVKLLSAIRGREWRPSYICLSLEPRFRHKDELDQIFGCKVHLQSNRNSVGFSSHILDEPVSTANGLVYRLLGEYLARVRIAPCQSLIERVETYIRSSMGTASCTVVRCAANLEMSVRSLQIRLASEGKNFSGLVEQLRNELAGNFLADSDLPLEQISHLLGYSDQASFGRAFRRWSGITPKQYRFINREPALGNSRCSLA